MPNEPHGAPDRSGRDRSHPLPEPSTPAPVRLVPCPTSILSACNVSSRVSPSSTHGQARRAAGPEEGARWHEPARSTTPTRLTTTVMRTLSV